MRMGGREQGVGEEGEQEEGGRAERGGREGARGWCGLEGEMEGGIEHGGREEAMMLGRQRAQVKQGRVEGWRVDEGNERGRDRTRHGRWEGGSERRRD